MYKYYADLHIHSCLSPCGDDDNTPCNIVNMACLKNLTLIAVTDHNTVRNAVSAVKAAEINESPIIVVPGVEITTSEEIHTLLYFPDCDTALRFEEETLLPARMMIKNKPEFFGRQLIFNEADEQTGEDEHLLISATAISIDDMPAVAKRYGAAFVPAHIDKDANSLIAILGDFPRYLEFSAIEVKDKSKVQNIRDIYNLGDKRIFTSSDAHYLWDILEAGEGEMNAIEIETTDEIKSAADFVRHLI
ncbi:histidinol-phosphatase [Clostridia bacterium]|nr:histidinol-phosphatase [Clostridia bacterium]